MLSKPKRIAALGVLIYLVGCGDGTGPPAEMESPPSVRTDAEMNMLRQSVVTADRPDDYGTQFESTSQPKPLETYSISFWADADADNEVSIRYADGADFLTFTVPQGALLLYPDGTPFDSDDGVQISITVDPTLLLVTMEPSGLTFSPTNPAILDLRYADADPDYNGDGTVDQVDADLEDDLLLWTQVGDNELWYPVSADQTLSEKRFTGYLYHFCNYTVSW